MERAKAIDRTPRVAAAAGGREANVGAWRFNLRQSTRETGPDPNRDCRPHRELSALARAIPARLASHFRAIGSTLKWEQLQLS